nr:hypothetical protein [Mesorhizobium sp. B2-1-8]
MPLSRDSSLAIWGPASPSGHDGAIGGFVSQGHLPAYTRAEVQLGRSFFRADLREFEEVQTRSLTLRYLFARYARLPDGTGLQAGRLQRGPFDRATDR